MPNFDIAGPQIQTGQDKVLRELSRGRKNLLEVGSWTGRSAAVLGQSAKDSGGRLFCVDWFKGSPGTQLDSVAKSFDVYEIFRSNMIELGLWDHITVFRMTSKEAAANIIDESLDFIFIDADHMYEGVKADLDIWYPKLKDGGVFCGHYYESDEYDEEHINQDYVNEKHHGVIKAVNEKFGKVDYRLSCWWIEK